MSPAEVAGSAASAGCRVREGNGHDGLASFADRQVRRRTTGRPPRRQSALGEQLRYPAGRAQVSYVPPAARVGTAEAVAG